MELTTTFLGFRLPHPLIAGASPLADSLDGVRRLEDAGAAAIVLRSLFEEQINAERLATFRATQAHAEAHVEARSYLPEPELFVMGPDAYLEHLRRVKEAVDVPVIASLNGASPGGWLEHATWMQSAGADALELNVYHVPTDASTTGEEVERRLIEMVAAVRRAVTIPLAVKLSPFYTSPANVARKLDAAGVDGLVLFNRFFEPDINIEELCVESSLQLSDSSELLLRLRWLAILSGVVRPSLAVTGGVHTAFDAIKAIMCGAHGVQIVSALLKFGPDYLRRIRQDLVDWMLEKEYESLEQMRGSMNRQRCPNPETFERANYMHLLQTWTP